MGKITKEQIQQINELYHKCGVKAQVARELGISAGTVSRYIIPGWQPVIQEQVKHIYLSDLSPSPNIVKCLAEYGDICVLSQAEREEMIDLWKEISV